MPRILKREATAGETKVAFFLLPPPSPSSEHTQCHTHLRRKKGKKVLKIDKVKALLCFETERGRGVGRSPGERKKGEREREKKLS